MTKVELLRNIQEGRRKLLQALDGLNEEEMTRNLVNSEWTVKDILGHITSWEEEDRKVAERILKEENPNFGYVISPENDWKEWNVQQANKKNDLSLERVLGELREEHSKLVDFVQGLTEEQLSRTGIFPWKTKSTVGELIRMTYEHDEEHVEKILAWRRMSKVKGNS